MNFVSSAEHIAEVNNASPDELSLWAAAREVCLGPFVLLGLTSND